MDVYSLAIPLEMSCELGKFQWKERWKTSFQEMKLLGVASKFCNLAIFHVVQVPIVSSCQVCQTCVSCPTQWQYSSIRFSSAVWKFASNPCELPRRLVNSTILKSRQNRPVGRLLVLVALYVFNHPTRYKKVSYQSRKNKVCTAKDNAYAQKRSSNQSCSILPLTSTFSLPPYSNPTAFSLTTVPRSQSNPLPINTQNPVGA